MSTPKAAPKPAPRAITVRDNLPPGAAIRMTPAAVEALVRLFGPEVLRRAAQERHGAGGG